ncbi:MAG: hypothetical protein HRU15_00335 [Planctomycetes bacterium]|nr:hypothetical protein [Planctomycetota bacterium]
MKFDQYWQQLIHKVYDSHEALGDFDRQLFLVHSFCDDFEDNGILLLIERRWYDFEKIIEAVRHAGFDACAKKLKCLGRILFEDAVINEGEVDVLMGKIYADDAFAQCINKSIKPHSDVISERIQDLREWIQERGATLGLYEL